MAATCSHISTNASAPSAPSHSRDVSTISSTLVHTNTTVHSQPTEPLLRPTTPEAGQHRDVPSHPSRSSERSLGLPGWSQSHIMSSHTEGIASEKGFKNPLKRVKLLRWIKNGLAIVMGKLILYLYASGWKHTHNSKHLTQCHPQHLIFFFACIERR